MQRGIHSERVGSTGLKCFSNLTFEIYRPTCRSYLHYM